MLSPQVLRPFSAGSAALFLAAYAAAPDAHATTVQLVTGNQTPAYYNNSIGDLGGTLPWFPAANTFGGSRQVFDSEPDLSGGAATLGDWLTDPANLSDNWSLVSTVPAGWAVNTEVAIVYEIDAGPGLTNILASFALVDNGIHIWVNGVWKFSARDPVGIGWNLVSLGSVGPGTSYIQILLEDSGGATSYLSPSITATVVPVPFAGWLFASALAALAGWRRMLRQA